MKGHLVQFYLVMLYIWGTNTSEPIRKEPTSCVDIPQTPFYGKLTLEGSFKITLSCSQANRDIPLTSPGDDGVLYCSTSSNNLHFSSLKIPDCLRRVGAKTIAMSVEVRLEGGSDRCPSSFDLMAMTDRLLDFVQSIIGDTKRDLCPGCSVRSQRGGLCQSQRNTGRTQISLMLEIFTSYAKRLRARYPDIRKAILGILVNQKEVLPTKVSPGYRSTVGVIDVREWRALCDSKVAEGAPLDVSGTPSCRGCPKNMYKMTSVAKCVPCEYGYYTDAAFATTCKTCPKKGLSDEEKKACFTRTAP